MSLAQKSKIAVTEGFSLRGAEPNKDRRGDEVVYEEVDDEPEVMPAGIAFGISDEIEDRWIEIEIRFVGDAGVNSFQVDLWGYDEKDADDNGDH